MKLHIQELNIRGPAPPISYTSEYTVNMKTKSKLDYLKVDIKTHTGETGREVISLYVTVFNKGSLEAYLKFQTMLQKIIKGQSLRTGPKMYAITKNILAQEALHVFNQYAKTN